LRKLLICGDSQYASLVAHYFGMQQSHELCGFVVDDEYFQDGEINGLPKYQLSKVMKSFSTTGVSIFCAIGYSSMRARSMVFHRLATKGFQFANCISEQSYVDQTVKMGSNNIIMPGAVIERGVVLGDNNIFWSNTTICHDSTIGSHNFFAANSTIGGNVQIGEHCFLGFNTVVLQGIVVKNETLLGASSMLMECAEDCGKYLGTPAVLTGRHIETGICIK